jgi:XTP/dITP diphosphohydrolase
MKLLFATNNTNKALEIQELLGNLYQILSLQDINCTDEVPEDQETIIGNAQQKAHYIYEKFAINVFADDTGLEIEALDNAPGVYSARFAGPQRNSEDNINKVLELLKDKDNRNAQFKTVICLIFNGIEYLFEGIVKGTIIYEKRGTQGFGYDSIFVPIGHEKTFAEMSIKEKSFISHRGIAVKKMLDFLKTF